MLAYHFEIFKIRQVGNKKAPDFQGLNLKMGRKMRLELTTSGTTNQRSNQLSYIRHQLIGLYFARFLIKSQVKKQWLPKSLTILIIYDMNSLLRSFL